MKNIWLTKPPLVCDLRWVTLLTGEKVPILPEKIKELKPCCHGSQVILKNGVEYSVKETYNLARKILWEESNEQSLVREGSTKKV